MPSFLFACLLFITSVTVAAPLGPVSQGSGGANLASTEATETMSSNPASIVHAPPSETAFFYGRNRVHEGSQSLTLSFVDNYAETLIPGGLSYTFTQGQLEPTLNYDYKEHNLTLAVAQFIYKQLSLGILTDWTRRIIKGDRTYTQWKMGLGLHWNPTHYLGFGLAHHRIVKENKNNLPGFNQDPSWGLGVLVIPYDFIRLRADLKKLKSDSKAWQANLGFESIYRKVFVVRLGYQTEIFIPKEEREPAELSLGLTIKTPRFNVDYAASWIMADTEARWVHLLGLRVF